VSTAKLCSLLLQYPDDDLIGARPEVVEAVAGLRAGRKRRALTGFTAWWAAQNPGDLRSAYVETFDFDRANALHLTYHSHGDGRGRGVALIKLKRRYDEAGLVLETSELPDFLPLMLEFADIAPDPGRAALTSHRAQLEVLRRSLHAAASPWAAVLDVVCADLPRLSRREERAAERMAADGPPEELVGLEPYGEAVPAEVLR
jgi:nitrate reductase delta subunit